MLRWLTSVLLPSSVIKRTQYSGLKRSTPLNWIFRFPVAEPKLSVIVITLKKNIVKLKSLTLFWNGVILDSSDGYRHRLLTPSLSLKWDRLNLRPCLTPVSFLQGCVLKWGTPGLYHTNAYCLTPPCLFCRVLSKWGTLGPTFLTTSFPAWWADPSSGPPPG